MTFTINKMEIVGYVGADAEVRNMQSGEKVANISVATTERWKDASGNQQERTEWHRVTVFNKKIVELLEKWGKKGRYVRVIGKLQTRKYQDQDGKDVYTTDIICQSFNFLDSKPNANADTTPTNDNGDTTPVNEAESAEVPF